MLRMGFMPSDFHPLVLILGERMELIAISDALELLSNTGRSLNLNEIGIFSTDTEVVISEFTDIDNECPGLIRISESPNKFTWFLTREKALDFALDIKNLVEKDNSAGSVTLECELLDEIVVKISFGEWEDSYLTNEDR